MDTKKTVLYALAIAGIGYSGQQLMEPRTANAQTYDGCCTFNVDCNFNDLCCLVPDQADCSADFPYYCKKNC